MRHLGKGYKEETISPEVSQPESCSSVNTVSVSHISYDRSLDYYEKKSIVSKFLVALYHDFSRIVYYHGLPDQALGIINSNNYRSDEIDYWNYKEEKLAPHPLGNWKHISNLIDFVERGNVDIDELNLVIFLCHIVSVLMMIDDVL